MEELLTLLMIGGGLLLCVGLVEGWRWAWRAGRREECISDAQTTSEKGLF